jgi:Flp pilus assembly protein TadG
MASLRGHIRHLRSERGAELIEMAMVTPILLLLIGAIVDFGFVFRSWEVVTNAAREGARVGVLPAYSCTPGAAGDVQPRVETYLASSGITGATINVATNTVAGFQTCDVHVEMFQQLPSLGVFAQMFGGTFTSVRVGSRASMRTETQAP